MNRILAGKRHGVHSSWQNDISGIGGGGYSLHFLSSSISKKSCWVYLPDISGPMKSCPENAWSAGEGCVQLQPKAGFGHSRYRKWLTCPGQTRTVSQNDANGLGARSTRYTFGPWLCVKGEQVISTKAQTESWTPMDRLKERWVVQRGWSGYIEDRIQKWWAGGHWVGWLTEEGLIYLAEEPQLKIHH